MGDNDDVNELIKTRKDGKTKWKDIRAEVNTTFALSLSENAVRKRFSAYEKKLAKTASAPAPASAPGPTPASAPASVTEAATAPVSATPLIPTHQPAVPLSVVVESPVAVLALEQCNSQIWGQLHPTRKYGNYGFFVITDL